jgi:acyl-CoA hydrolase
MLNPTFARKELNMAKSKKAAESCATATHIVLPDDTNTLGNLMGGRLMYWMDVIAAVAAHRHCNRVVVTASVNNISFNQPIKLGDFVTLESKVSRAFGSSMEVFIEVYVEDHRTGAKKKCNEAIFTFVAVDQIGNTIDVPELIPETDVEKQRYDAALRRKQLSLILAGRMKPADATELKAIFEDLTEK